jgi:hypothetical protein
LQQPVNAWADYTSNSSLTFKQEQMNKGDAALVELFSQQNKWLETKAQNGLNYETFQTGGGTGRENAFRA